MKAKSYRDFLKLKGLKPIVIQRSNKNPGDLLLVGSHLPMERVVCEERYRR